MILCGSCIVESESNRVHFLGAKLFPS
jgi:hypothetical protein